MSRILVSRTNRRIVILLGLLTVAFFTEADNPPERLGYIKCYAFTCGPGTTDSTGGPVEPCPKDEQSHTTENCPPGFRCIREKFKGTYRDKSTVDYTTGRCEKNERHGEDGCIKLESAKHAYQGSATDERCYCDTDKCNFQSAYLGEVPGKNTDQMSGSLIISSSVFVTLLAALGIAVRIIIF